MMDQKHRVLVTGAFGFIGYHLTKALLEKGYEVIAFGHRNKRTERFFSELETKYKDALECIEGDLYNDDEMHNLLHDNLDLTGVFHLAARKMTTKTTSVDLLNLITDNYCMDDSIFSFCEDLLNHKKVMASGRGIKMVYVSTGEVYGATFFTGKPMEEDTMCTVDPNNERYQYMASKIMGEMTLRHSVWGFDWNIVRLQNPYGPLMDHNMIIPKMVRELIKTKETGSGSLNVATMDTRPYVYIDDVVKGLIAVYEKGKPRETYNLAGNEVSIGRMAIEASQKYTGGNMAIGTANIGNGEHRRMSIKKIELLWSPETSIEDGVDKMYKFYLKHDAVERAMKQIGL